MRISAIVAIDEKNGMGKAGGIPWHIPGEQKRFKEITTPHPMIMGRKTFESIGRILPNRPHIIVSRDSSYKVAGAMVVATVQEAVNKAKDLEEQRFVTASNSSVILSDSEESSSSVIPGHSSVISTLSEAPNQKSVQGEVEGEKSPQEDRIKNLPATSDQRPATENEIFIIGGGQIFQESMQYIDKIYLTLIQHDFACDTFFPDYSAFTEVVEKEEKHDWEYPYTFLTLEK